MFFMKELPTRDVLDRYSQRFAPGQTDKIQSAIHFMRDASVLIRNVETYFSGHGFSILKFQILIVIDRETDRNWLTHSEIVNKLDVSKPVMSRTLKSLLDGGYLRLCGDESDARIKRFILTPEGEAKLEAMLPGYYRLLTELPERPKP